MEINPRKGWCTWTVSNKEQFVDENNLLEGHTFWEIRPAMVMLPASSYAKIKSSFIKICKQQSNCNADIAKWERSLRAMDSQLKAKEHE